MNVRKSLLFLACLLLFNLQLDAAIVRFDNVGTTTGDLLDGIELVDIGTAAATVAVSELPGLNLSVIGLSTSGGTSDPELNVTATSMGINATGDSDTDAFESAFSQSVTFQFDQAVTISQLDFTTFDSGDTFSFAGVAIGNSDLSNGTLDLYDFVTPLSLAANTPFTLQATAGTVGIEAIDVSVTAVPEPASLFSLIGIGAVATGIHHRRKSRGLGRII